MAQRTAPSYLDPLNPEQRAAVLHWNRSPAGKGSAGSLLILAGAGSGKTRVITTKIAYLIREQGVDPFSILAVTFTNKAAREMADRARIIDERAGNAMLRTFHSFGAWFLRRNGGVLGLKSGFVIYDDDDTAALLSTIMEDASKAEIRETARDISRAKDYFLSPGDAELDSINHRTEFRRIYRRYEERLAEIGNVDFGDLIKKPVEALRAQRELGDRFRSRFSVILVDEYQDSNIAQFELLRELRGPETYLCVVGDDDQSIYRFRGAEVRNILEFPDRFPGTDIIRLERNYRSCLPILALASAVVGHNQGRLGKTLKAERRGGKTPVLAFLPDQEGESAYCAELIEASVRRGEARYSDWAILYRTNAQSLGFETELLRRGIPYRVVGSLKFYEREEVKDTLALLAFLVNPRDEVAFRRIVNKPSRGIGPATVDRIVDHAWKEPEEALALNFEYPPAAGTGGDLAVAAKKLIPSLSSKAASGIRDFLAALEGGRSVLEGKGKKSAGTSKKSRKFGWGEEGLRSAEGLSICIVRLVEDSGLAEYHLDHDDISGNQRLDNLQELANAASLYPGTFEGLLEFLEHIELDRSMGEETSVPGADKNDAVTLITLHNTKGLEYRRVIMTGLEQGLFPRENKKDADLEEERRLFYVGATRAMDELYLSSCAARRVFGRTMPCEPSLFLREAGTGAFRVIGSVPYGLFRSPGPAGRENGAGFPAETSSDGRWRRGERIFHDDYGYGAVADIRKSDEGPVILVRFETGKELRFLSAHQSSRIMKVERDD
jgi:DNA helicase-2/ATP-dependent DNA helicase PcrA